MKQEKNIILKTTKKISSMYYVLYNVLKIKLWAQKFCIAYSPLFSNSLKLILVIGFIILLTWKQSKLFESVHTHHTVGYQSPYNQTVLIAPMQNRLGAASSPSWERTKQRQTFFLTLTFSLFTKDKKKKNQTKP